MRIVQDDRKRLQDLRNIRKDVCVTRPKVVLSNARVIRNGTLMTRPRPHGPRLALEGTILRRWRG